VIGAPARARVRHCDRVLARAALASCLAVYVATFSGLSDNPDGEVSFQTTSALWREHGFALAGTPEADGIAALVRSGAPDAPPARRGGPGREEDVFGSPGIGQALAALPLYAAGRAAALAAGGVEERHSRTSRRGLGQSEYFAHLFVGLRNPLLSALTALLVVLAARRLGVERRAAFLAGLSYGLTTFAWAQARSWLSDVQATFCLFAAFHSLLKLQEQRARGPARPLTLLAFGLALGWAGLTRLSVAPAVVALDLAAARVLWARRGSARSLALVALPQLACLAALLVLDHLRFGSVWETGYGAPLPGLFGGSPWTALAGLLAAPGKGLVWMAPAVLLFAFGLARPRRGVERLWLFCTLAVFLAILLPAAALRGWHGAWTYGPRYLLPALPFVWLGVARALERARERPGLRRLATGLLVLGLLVQVPSALVDTMTFHDLAVRAAPARWTAPLELPAAEREARLFERIQLDWGFAAPWAHWRILRRRVAVGDEVFPVREIFFVDSDEVLEPTWERERGWNHLAWIDLARRLSGPTWPGVVLAVALAGLGLVLALRALDPGAARR